jgi:hypothetical protein
MLRTTDDPQPFVFRAEGFREGPPDRARSSVDFNRSVRSRLQIDQFPLLLTRRPDADPGDVRALGVGKLGVALDIDARRPQANSKDISKTVALTATAAVRTRAITGNAAS